VRPSAQFDPPATLSIRNDCSPAPWWQVAGRYINTTFCSAPGMAWSVRAAWSPMLGDDDRSTPTSIIASVRADFVHWLPTCGSRLLGAGCSIKAAVEVKIP
jgi:hypothetical protein